MYVVCLCITTVRGHIRVCVVVIDVITVWPDTRAGVSRYLDCDVLLRTRHHSCVVQPRRRTPAVVPAQYWLLASLVIIMLSAYGVQFR